MKQFWAALLLAVAACGDTAGAANDNDVAQFALAPELELTGRVVDQADLFSEEQDSALSEKLAALETATTDQLVIVTVRSLNGHEPQEFASALGRHWRIGRKDVNNGIIFLVAPNEREVFIATGYGVEWLVTDQWLGAMIRSTLLPRFKEGQFYEGVSEGVGKISEKLSSDKTRPYPEQKELKEAA